MNALERAGLERAGLERAGLGRRGFRSPRDRRAVILVRAGFAARMQTARPALGSE
jgi:hypothetical protein